MTEQWYDDPDRATEMATVTGSHQPDDLDDTADAIHEANIHPGPPPEPNNLADAANNIARYARRAPIATAGRVINQIVIDDQVVAAIWFAYMGNIPLGTDDAIDRVCTRHIHAKLTEPIRPELGTLVQELRERRVTQTGDLPEVRT